MTDIPQVLREALQTSWTKISPRSRRIFKWMLVSVLVGIVLFYLGVVIFPQLFAEYWHSEIKKFLYEDLGLSGSWSTFLSIILSLLYASMWAPLFLWTLRTPFWTFDARKLVLGLVGAVVIYGPMPLAHALLGGENCVNQRTGEAIKWYFVNLGGVIVLRDSPGFESTNGTARHPATAQICRIKQLQAQGIRPQAIGTNPRDLKFFDDITGEPRVWYHKTTDGQIELFDAEGMHPRVGEALKPATREIAREAQDRALAAEVAAERAARAKLDREQQQRSEAEFAARQAAARAEAEAKETARRALVELFNVSSYSSNVVIVGAAPRRKDELSGEAAQQLLKLLIAALRRDAVTAEEFAPRVYLSGQFFKMIDGNAVVLSDVGLMACTRFRRHRVRCFNGTGGGSWRGENLRGNSSLRLCG